MLDSSIGPHAIRYHAVVFCGAPCIYRGRWLELPADFAWKFKPGLWDRTAYHISDTLHAAAKWCLENAACKERDIHFYDKISKTMRLYSQFDPDLHYAPEILHQLAQLTEEETFIHLLDEAECAGGRCQGAYGETPFHLAAQKGFIKALQVAEPSMFRRIDCYCRTPLHWAYRCDQAEAIRFLLFCGADPTVQDCNDHKPADLRPVKAPTVAAVASILGKHAREESEPDEIEEPDVKAKSPKNALLFQRRRKQPLTLRPVPTK